jgi:radical SAM superfamily enzyme YgiQ (UPF0313 family)
VGADPCLGASAGSDLLLSHGYCLAEDEHEREIMMPYPPLGILYLSSHLKRRGFRVEVHDTTFGSLASFRAQLQACRPAVVGLSCNLMTKGNVLRMIAMCREAGAFVVLGGPEPAPNAEEYLNRGADVVVVGEGEATLEELLRHLPVRGLEGLERVRGIRFLDREGTLRATEPRPLLQPLGDQPWPDREAIDIGRYLRTWRDRHGYSSMSLITARGCPYTCTWCSHAVFGQTHRRRSVSDVADEVATLVARYAPERLWYADDVFTLHRPWILDYARELERRGLHVPFECISRADRITEQVADALAAMGCARLWIGSESGSQRVLDAMKRLTTVEDVQAKTAMLQARGIQVGMFIMLGFDGEDESDLAATVEHLKRANPDTFLTTVAYPIKGTEFYERVAGRVRSDLPWEVRTDRDLRLAGRHSRRYYEHATRWLVNDVRLHRARRQGPTDWPGMGRMYLAACRGRLGMWWTRREREDEGIAAPAGRGWPAGERREPGASG